MNASVVAQALLHARLNRVAVPAQVPADAEAAYAAQDEVARALGWFETPVARHWKSGAPSRQAVQTHAALPPAGVWASPADGRGWHWRLRGVEAELALRLGREVTPALAAALDVEAARGLVDAICAAIELVDSRWAEALDAPPLAKLADLQSHGALVLGDWQDFAPFVVRDWSAQACSVRIGRAPVQAFRGSHPLADPAFVLPAWLRHATRHGYPVPAGTVLTTGTWCGLLHAQAGDRVSVEFPSIGQAVVQL